MRDVEFICPQCGNSRVERLETSAVITYEVYGFNPGEELQYEDTILQEVNPESEGRYQCYGCGWILPIADDSEDGLLEWLYKQPYNVEKHLEDL